MGRHLGNFRRHDLDSGQRAGPQARSERLRRRRSPTFALAPTPISRTRMCGHSCVTPRMLAWLETNTQVRYRSIPYTDYRQEVPGAKLGYRTHDPVPLDGKLLGPLLSRCGRPRQRRCSSIASPLPWMMSIPPPPPARMAARPVTAARTLLLRRRSAAKVATQPLPRCRQRPRGKVGLSVRERNIPLWLEPPLSSCFAAAAAQASAAPLSVALACAYASTRRAR